MRRTIKTRLLGAVAVVCAALALSPLSAFAAEGDVAQIDDQTYATLDEAFDAASKSADESVNIQILTNCAIDKRISVSAGKSVTVSSTSGNKYTVTDNGRNGASLRGVLVFENANLVTDGQIYLYENADLTFRNSDLSMDGEMYQFNEDGYYCCAISLEKRTTSLTFDNSSVTIKNYPASGSAIRWDDSVSGDGYGITIENGSVFESYNCYASFTGTCNIVIDESTVSAHDHRGNGSNGSNFTISNDSKVNFYDNGSHGISASSLDIQTGSKVTSTNNGMYGVYCSTGFQMDGTSTLEVTKNSSKGDYAGLKLTSGVTDGKVQAGAIVNITGNYCSGLSNNGKCVFEEGSHLTITGNNNDKGTTSNGGGVYNFGASANLTLPSDAVIYNNHAKTAGDDIYNNAGATLTIPKVGADWMLDDCSDMIDGYYDDSADARWAAHEDEESDNHIELCKDTSISGLAALKAAHGTGNGDKISLPGLEKKIIVDGEEVDEDAVLGGQMVNFQLESNVPENLGEYVSYNHADNTQDEPVVSPMSVGNAGEYVLKFHDEMASVLTDPSNFEVTIERAGEAGTKVLTSDQYTLVSDPTDDYCTFEVALDLAALYNEDVINEADFGVARIVVTYTATVQEGVTAGNYLNTAWVSYPEDESEKDTVTVKVYGLEVFKHDQTDANKGLAGAKFQLYQKDSDGKIIENSIVKLESSGDGYVHYTGLEEGDYFLKETQAPEGYVCSDTEVEFNVPNNAGENNIVHIDFANSSVPHTGGSGTTMFTIAGAVVLIAAGVLYVVTRKRKDQNR